jgi:hypothetical protein
LAAGAICRTQKETTMVPIALLAAVALVFILELRWIACLR